MNIDSTALSSHVVYQRFSSLNIPETLILRDGSTYSALSLTLLKVPSFVDFYKQVFEDTIMFEETSPHLVCTGTGTLPQLETLKYSTNTTDYLNQQGLSIYLFEDLYLSTGPKVKNYLKTPPVSVGVDEYYKKYSSFIRGFESTKQNLENIYSFELESIKVFIDINNLKNVTVYCGDYNASKYLQKAYPMMKILNRNSYIVSVATRILKNLESSISQKTANLISHKFICANRKYKSTRHLTSAYLLDKTSIISFDKTTSYWGSLQNQLWFNLSSWKSTQPKLFMNLWSNLQRLETMPPLTFDKTSTDIPEANFELSFNYTPEEIYNRCFCSVVTENFSHPISTFSEKTLNTIASHRPFILVAPPHTLEYLKHYGFKTFGDYWDESYDREENHEKRLIKVFKTIDYINNLPITALRNLYQTLIPILEHNYQVIKTIPKEWPCE
jgi:hypothetical protein